MTFDVLCETTRSRTTNTLTFISNLNNDRSIDVSFRVEQKQNEDVATVHRQRKIRVTSRRGKNFLSFFEFCQKVFRKNRFDFDFVRHPIGRFERPLAVLVDHQHRLRCDATLIVKENKKKRSE